MKYWPKNSFPIFCILYMSAFLMEMTESWRDVGFSCFFLIAICFLSLTSINRIKFLVFLLLSTGYVLGFRFPEVANHVNLILLLNIPLILAILHSQIRPTLTDDEFFERIKPVLRIALALVYVLAGFHKLNHDFFNPIVSCAGALLFTGFSPILVSNVFGIPSIFLLLGSLAIAIGLLRENLLLRFPHIVRLFLLALLLPLSLAIGKIIILSLTYIPSSIQASCIIILAWIVMLWELVGGGLLLVRRCQGAVLLVSGIMHVSLGLIGFVDFSSLAFVLLFAFIPERQLNLLEANSSLTIGNRHIHRAHGYFLILVLGSVLTGIHYRLGLEIGDIVFLNGLLLAIAVLVLMWPVVNNLVSSNRITWAGVPIWNSQTPKFLFLFLLLIALHGITPYLGLRTAGNFSMFSNLRTEGNRSNHLILGDNPLKIWGYQEDVVEVLEFDDEYLDRAYNLDSLERYTLPVVELKKLIYQWTQASRSVPIYFVYNGILHSSQDIVNDPNWATTERDWQMYLMDFRVIQPAGPNQCRW